MLGGDVAAPVGGGEALMHDKVDLFLSLFRGRVDVHAHGYRRKDGGIGYAPARKNEWWRGVCPPRCGQQGELHGVPGALLPPTRPQDAHQPLQGCGRAPDWGEGE